MAKNESYRPTKSGGKADYGNASASKVPGKVNAGGRGPGGATEHKGESASNQKTYEKKKSGSKSG